MSPSPAYWSGCSKQPDIPVIWTVQEHLQPDRSRQQKRLPSHTERRSRVAALAGTWDAAIVDASWLRSGG